MSVTPRDRNPNTPTSNRPTSIQPRDAAAALASLGWPREQVEVIRATLAPGASDMELYLFLYLAKEYGLDPFKREIYFTRDRNGRPVILTGIDGFRKIARRNPAYEGVIAQAVREGDEFAFDPSNYTVAHRFGQKRGKVLGAWARADAKDRKPVLVWVDFDEYYRSGWDAWERMPATMIAKVAEAQAIRRQFGLGGLYTDDEIPSVTADTPSPAEVESEPGAQIDAGLVFTPEDVSAPQGNDVTEEALVTAPQPVPPTPAPVLAAVPQPAPQTVQQTLAQTAPTHSAAVPQQPASPPAEELATPAQRNFLRGLFKRKFPEGNLENWLKQKVGVGSVEELTRRQCSELIDRLKALPDSEPPVRVAKEALDLEVAGSPQPLNYNGHQYLAIPCYDSQGNVLDVYITEGRLPVIASGCQPGLKLRVFSVKRKGNAVLAEKAVVPVER